MLLCDLCKDRVGCSLHALLARYASALADVATSRGPGNPHKRSFDLLLGVNVREDRLGREKGTALAPRSPAAAKLREPDQTRFVSSNCGSIGLQNRLGTIVSILPVKELPSVGFLHVVDFPTGEAESVLAQFALCRIDAP